jgi:RecB family endonuclease NucS
MDLTGAELERMSAGHFPIGKYCFTCDDANGELAVRYPCNTAKLLIEVKRRRALEARIEQYDGNLLLAKTELFRALFLDT